MAAGKRSLKAKPLRITKGGRRLAQYLEFHEIGVVEFAKKAEVSRVTLRHVIKGQRWRHITVRFALRVCAATGGRLKFEEFDEGTATDADADDEEPGRLRPTGT